MIYILILLLAVASGFFRGIVDTLSFRFERSIFRNRNPIFWNPKYSWKNKWKNGDADVREEKFMFSSTALVVFTDAYHLFRMIYRLLFAACFTLTGMTDFSILGTAILALVIHNLAFQSSFELMYNEDFT